MFVQRRMESECGTLDEERKKPRTAEADAAAGDAGRVMGESGNSVTHADIGDENRMSVDCIVGVCHCVYS